MHKKDGGLRPCIDYRGLNEITVKFKYPLPLVPAALEQLCTYIDNILIYSDTFEKHVCQVRAVLKWLIHHQLYAKAEKCEFHRTSTAFLGYIISSEGIAMDEQKVTAVLNWPQPTTLKELQWFLGFANFYRRFIRNFSAVANPLMSMVKKGINQLNGPMPRFSPSNN